MFSYKFPVAIVTAIAFLQPPIVIAQDIAEVNNIARNISVKITGYGNGSGFILEREGNVYSVVTNKHVVAIDTEYEIQTHDGAKHRVTSRQEIPDLDLAIIQFESTGEYQVAELGDSDELEQRQSISVAGFPGEQTDIDIIDGQIRSIRQEIIADPASKQGYALIYTNQTLPGSSGGAVLDGDGRVVAINGEKERDIKTGIDVSRGIPINLFLVAEEKLSAIKNSIPRNIRNDTDNLINRGSTISEAKNTTKYQLAHTTNQMYHYGVNSAAISWDKIVSGGDDNTIQVRNLVTREIEYASFRHVGVNSVEISRDKIVSGSDDGTIKVWNSATGELERTLTYHYGINSIKISWDKIVSGSDDGTIEVWNLDTGKLEHTLTGHSSSVNSVAISGGEIISGSADTTIKVWNLATGELIQTLTGHSGRVWSVAVNRGNIVSSSLDETIKVWQLSK